MVPTDERLTMSKLIRCECGYVARGDDDEQVVAAIRRHMVADHPALLAQVDPSDIFGWIEAE
jgi:Protein of unknown function (DUF1059)